MGEGQPRYDTAISNEYYYKYRSRNPVIISLFYGSDRNIPEKTWIGFKYGVCAGVFAVVMSAGYEQTKLVFSREVESAIKHGTPWVIAGTVYGLSMSTIANLRHKDDELNHLFGGVAAGTAIGSWYKSAGIGGWAALIFAVFGLGIKVAQSTENERGFSNDLRIPKRLNRHRLGWFIERPDHEGIADGDKDDSFKRIK
uniref:NADH dehydrogenase [ubiquinone] 1 alpha subcomplex subunit 11 n=1 Tax=Arion vulgaris TaxID=1028688 RepID=A0A0B7B8N7_9EUPU